MKNNKKVELANNIISSLTTYINEITQLGNECAYTDRILDEIIENTNKLTTDYRKICNETQNIYVVIEKWACDLESGSSVVAFDSKDKALKYKNNRVVEIEQEYDYDTCEDDEDSYSAYNNGYYAENHTDIWVEELKVNEYDI